MFRSFSRSSTLLALGAGLVAALTACGGSSSPKAADTSTTASSASTTTTVATVPAADPLAAVAVIAAADAGAGFTHFRDGAGSTPFGAQSCAIRAGSPLGVKDHVYLGPMFKESSGLFFLYSESYVFRTEAQAKQYVAVRATAAYRSCKVAQDDAAERKVHPTNHVKLSKVPFTDPSRRVVSMYRELQGGPDGAGKYTDVAYYDKFTFRHGRVVVVIAIDAGIPTSEAQRQVLGTRIAAALSSVSTAIDGRLTAAHV